MSSFFVYLLKSSISLTLFYIVFRLAMSRDKNHSLNRFLLLGILVVSAVIPFLKFQFFKEEVVIQPVSVIRDFIYMPIEFSDISQSEIIAEPTKSGLKINWWLLGYSLAIAGLFIRLVVSLARVIQLLRGSEKMPLKKFVIAVIKELIQPFSFLHYIIISGKDYQLNREAVIAHESEHIRQMHSIDLLVCEVFTLLHWFNPFMWLLRRDLKLIHEFQADQAVLNTGIDAKKYQLLVLEKAVGERRFALANHFTQKPILKRIKMMKKKKINRFSGIKLLMFVPLIFFMMSMNSGNKFNSGIHNFSLSALQDTLNSWMKNWSYENLESIGENILTETGHNPKYGDFKKTKPLSKDDVLWLIIDKDNNIRVKGEIIQRDELNSIIKDFVAKGINSSGNKVTEFTEKKLAHFGKVSVPQGIINFRFDVAATYWAVRETINFVGEIYLGIKDEYSIKEFDQPYLSLSEENKSEIDELIPIRISTGEPMVKDGIVSFAGGI